MVPANPVIGVRVGHADKSHLLGSFRLGSARVRLNSESKLLCPHGDDEHDFHNDRYS